MYEAYFGLEKRPFAATPDVSCAYLPDSIQEVLNELLLRVDAGEGIALLTAPAGTGKTLLCRKLADEIATRLPTIYIASANFPTRRALFQAILYELGAAYNGLDEQELRLSLQTQLKEIAHQGKSLLLILDEAHLLNARLLEEVRSLADLSEKGRPLLRVLLSGQPTLEERLLGPELDAVNQRLACHVYLEPLSRAEARDYVAFRTTWAGGNPNILFSPEALDLIAHGSNGIPRCINQLCDHSLLLAFVAESLHVTRELVDDALQDLKQLPLHWNDSLPAPVPANELETEDEAALDEIAALEIDELVSEPASDSSHFAEPATETFAIEFGAEPIEQTTHDDMTEPVATNSAAESASLTNAPSDQDMQLTPPRISFPGPLESLEHIELSPTIPLSLFQSDTDSTAWEPVVEDGISNEIRDTHDFSPILPSNHGGVVPLLDVGPQRFAGFQEESVVDPYARLDDDIRFARPGNSLTNPQFNPALDMPRSGNELPGIPHAAGEPQWTNPIPRQALPPDELLERIVPLLQEPTPSDKADAPAAKHSDQLPPLAAENMVEEAETPEEGVGSDVLDLCLEVQDYFARELQDATPATPPSVEGGTKSDSDDYPVATQFDIVEPEPVIEQTLAANHLHIDARHAEASKAGPLVPKPNYRRIFSLLRRKLGR